MTLAKEMKKDILRAYRGFLADDWAHRSYEDAEKVRHVRTILNREGIEVTESEIETAIKSTTYYRLMWLGCLLIGTGFITRNIDLPQQVIEITALLTPIGLIVIIGSLLANHFYPYHKTEANKAEMATPRNPSD